MNNGKFFFAQLASLVVLYEFDKCIIRYQGDNKVQDFSCWNQFLCMMFGQLTHQESSRDIITCLIAHRNKELHLGIKQIVAHSTLTRANENRSWKIYSDFVMHLISIVRPMYKNVNEFVCDLEVAVYALDSTTIDLCVSVFKWAKFRKRKGAIKMQTLLYLRGNIPTMIHVSDKKSTTLIF